PELHVNVNEVEPADWVAMALDGLPPVRAGRFVVAGAHALGRVNGGRKKIWIEASEAFGTGHHGTTMGCLMALEDYLHRPRLSAPAKAGVQQRPSMGPDFRRDREARARSFKVLDVGTGSGVLAIAAAKCGAEALAIEIDPRAAEIAAINAQQNKVANRVRVIA